jgi:hypothetical protein
MTKREVLLVLHPTRPEAKELAGSIVKTLSAEGFSFISSADTGISGVTQVASEQVRQMELFCVGQNKYTALTSQC